MRIHREVVPTASAAYLHLVEYLVAFGAERNRRYQNEQQSLLHRKALLAKLVVPAANVVAYSRRYHQ